MNEYLALILFALFVDAGVAALADALGKNAFYWFFISMVFTPAVTLPALAYVVVSDRSEPLRKAADGSMYPAREPRSPLRMAFGIGFAVIVSLCVAMLIGATLAMM